jgi:hypothetical protein
VAITSRKIKSLLKPKPPLPQQLPQLPPKQLKPPIFSPPNGKAGEEAVSAFSYNCKSDCRVFSKMPYTPKQNTFKTLSLTDTLFLALVVSSGRLLLLPKPKCHSVNRVVCTFFFLSYAPVRQNFSLIQIDTNKHLFIFKTD